MSPRLALFFSRRATREIRTASEWWDANRPAAPEAFRESLGKALTLIATQPEIGALYAGLRFRDVRRVYLSKVRYYLYYRVKRASMAVEVVALWHASRHPDPGV